jgi:iron complex outermembrane receptor protein
MNRCRALVLLTLLLSQTTLPKSAPAQTTDYTELSLEELTAVRIFTLGRKQATLFDTPNAASGATNEDLHRSGSLELAEALRLLPGMQVARIDSFQYAVTARGFNDATSNKLLVLMDGRSLYSTTSSGANWNYHELILEDVDRIELLRGPGASLWGANAMNGVINIVTRPAEETLGSMLTIARGNELDLSVALRQGVRLNAQTALRVYAKYHDEDDYGVATDTANRGWSNHLLGGRLDWQGRSGRRLTVIGEQRSLEIRSDTVFPALVSPYLEVRPETQRSRGGNVSAHWVQPVAGDGELSLLGTFERIDSTQVAYGEDRDTYSLDLQLTLHPGPRQEFITGITYRQDVDHLTSSRWLEYAEPDARTLFTGAYLQDEIAIVPDRFLVTLGSKFERNSFSGWETQPSLRAIARLNKQNRTWIGVSKAARTPSRIERGVDYFAYVFPPDAVSPLPVEVRAIGSADFDSEHVTALEFGHRYEPNHRLSFDLSLFYNRYEDLRGTSTAGFSLDLDPVPHIDQIIIADNTLRGTTHGGEFSARWQFSPALRIEGSVSAIRMALRENRAAMTADPSIAGLVGGTPHQEYKLRLQWDIRSDWSLDGALRYVDALPGPQLPAYTGFDARVAWRPNPMCEIDLVGRDLLDPSHAESSKLFIGNQVREISRSVYLRATLHF